MPARTRPHIIEVGTVVALTGSSRDTGELARAHYRTTLTLGALDDNARFAYTRGQCHALAAALAERTGWTVIVAVGGVDTTGYEPDEWVEHCLVETPDGWWLDVTGPHDPDGWVESRSLRDNEYLNVTRTDRDGVLALATRAGKVGCSPLLPPNLRAARAIAPAVLALLDG